MREFFRRIFYYIVVPLFVLGMLALTVWQVFLSPDKSVEGGGEAAAETQRNAPAEDPVLPDFKVKKPEISHLVDGVVKWTVSSESMKSDPGNGTVRLLDSRGTFVRDENSGLEFTAPVTVYNTKTKNIIVEGGVDGRLLPEDHSMRASGIEWNGESGIVLARDINIDMGKAKVTGKRMKIMPGEKKIEIAGNVRIVIEIDRRGSGRGAKLHKPSRP